MQIIFSEKKTSMKLTNQIVVENYFLGLFRKKSIVSIIEAVHSSLPFFTGIIIHTKPSWKTWTLNERNIDLLLTVKTASIVGREMQGRMSVYTYNGGAFWEYI